MYNKLIVLASRLFAINIKAGLLISQLSKFAAETTYYRAISIRSPKAGDTPQEKLENTKQQALNSISEIFNTGHINTGKNYPTPSGEAEFNVTRHWEVALYYATYQTERQLKQGNLILPIIVSGIINDEELILDPDELEDRALQWPSLEQIQNQTYDPNWHDFMVRNYGQETFQPLLAQYTNYLEKGLSPFVAKKYAVKDVILNSPEHARHQTHSVDPDFKDQLRIPEAKMAALPVQHVFLIQGDGSVAELTPANYQEEIAAWQPNTLEELREIKKNQPFSGVEEGYFPYATR